MGDFTLPELRKRHKIDRLRTAKRRVRFGRVDIRIVSMCGMLFRVEDEQTRLTVRWRATSCTFCWYRALR